MAPPLPSHTGSGVELIKLLVDYGADLDAANPKNWTPLSYCKAKGKYGATEEKGIYPEVGGERAGRRSGGLGQPRNGWAGRDAQRPWGGQGRAARESQLDIEMPLAVCLWRMHLCRGQAHLPAACARMGVGRKARGSGRTAAFPVWWGTIRTTRRPCSLASLLSSHPPRALQDVLLFYGATKYGSAPPALGQRSPRESFNPQAESFLRERGSYQNEPEHP